MPPPKKHIDKVQFEKLLAMNCTESEVCGYFEVDTQLITYFCKKEYNASYPELRDRFGSKGKIGIRRAQFQLATEKLHPGMLMYLGEKYLEDQKPVTKDIHIHNHLDQSQAAQSLLAALKNLIDAKSNERQTIDLKAHEITGGSTSYRSAPAEGD